MVRTLMSRGIRNALVFCAFAAILRLIVLCRPGRREKRPPPVREAALWLLVFYLAVLFSITVFARTFHPEIPLAERIAGINTTPFRETWKLYQNGAIRLFFINALGNIVWFVPVGLLWPWARPGRYAPLRALAAAMLISLCIETLQLLTGAGVCDIDDLIMNVSGGFLGILPIFLPKIRRTCRKYTQKSG